MTKIKFAVIGYGNIGKRHVHHIMANPDAELVGICDLQTEKITSEELKSIPVFSDHVDMLKQVDAEVINVCTPNYLHSVHTVEALKTGRHVVCEKPMATSSAECQRMIEAAEKMDKTIFVVKQNRYNEPVQQVKKLLNEKALGAIYFVNINCFWNRNEYYYNESSWRGKKRDDGGCLFTQFSHFIDILYYLFGDIDGVQGKVKNFNHPYTEVEDSGAFVIENKLGSIINFNFSTCSYQKNMEGAITILGEKGTVKIGGQYLNTIEYQHIENKILPAINISAKSNDYGQYQGSMSNHDRVIDNVIKTLRGQEKAMTNAYEGKKVVEIIEKMYSSASS
jgi:UDP-N-acetyl-2-amino-2-deoxyglucuronate dehydrogenase